MGTPQLNNDGVLYPGSTLYIYIQQNLWIPWSCHHGMFPTQVPLRPLRLWIWSQPNRRLFTAICWRTQGWEKLGAGWNLISWDSFLDIQPPLTKNIWIIFENGFVEIKAFIENDSPERSISRPFYRNVIAMGNQIPPISNNNFYQGLCWKWVCWNPITITV